MTLNASKSTLPAIAFALAALVSIPSAAHAGPETPTEQVPYGDLNLASHDGIKTLDRRLDRAVKRVCGFYDSRSLGARKEIAACYEKARASIVPQRQHAIARATGRQDNTQWAENSPRGHSMVTLAE